MKKLTLFSLLVMAMSFMNLLVFTQPSYADFSLDDIFAKTSADYTDLSGLSQDDKLKYDYVLQKNIISGNADNVFGVAQTVTRAELARDLVNIFSLTVDPAATSDFDDVKADDAVYGSAIPAIESVYNGKMMDAVDKKGKMFNPGGTVTREELATALLKGLKLGDTVAKTDPVKDDSVSKDAGRYVALALSLNIMANQSDGKFGGSVPVTKGDLALAAFGAVAQQPGKYFVLGAKQTKSHEVTVQFNQEIPTKGVLSIEQNGVVLNGVPKWSSDGKSVVMTMDDPLQKSTYQAVLSGLDDDTIGIGSVDFAAEEEKAKSIELAASSDDLPSTLVTIDVKAKNQYDEDMKLKPSELNVFTDLVNKTVSFNPDDQTLTLDLRDALMQAKKQVTVYVLDSSAGVTTQKTFKIVDMPMIKKLELGDIVFPPNQNYLKPGQIAYIPVKAYDQNGSLIMDTNILNQQIGVTDDEYSALSNIAGTNSHFVDLDGSGPELQLIANQGVDSDKQVTVNLFGPNNVNVFSKPIRIFAPTTPAKVEFYNFNDNLADGDGSSDIQINVFDASGYQLTEDEIVNAETLGQISVYSTGPVVVGANPSTRYDVTMNVYRPVAIEATSNKGEIRVDHVSGQGPGTVNVRITGLNKVYTLHVNARAAREPNTIWVDNGTDVPASKTKAYRISPNQKDGPTFKTLDQYKAQIKSGPSDLMVQLTVEKLAGDWGALKSVDNIKSLSNPTALVSLSTANRQIKFNSNPGDKYGTFKLTANLVKVDSSKNVIEVLDSASATCEIFNPATSDLLYSVDLDDDMLASEKLLKDAGLAPTVVNATYYFQSPDTKNLYQPFYYNHSVGISVTDPAGNALKVDTDTYFPVLSVSSDNTVVLATYGNNAIGMMPGTANVTIVFDTPHGVKQVTKTVTVHAESVNGELKINRTSYDLSTKKDSNGKIFGSTMDLRGLYVWNTNLVKQVQVNSQYGEQFVSQDGQDQINPYNGILFEVRGYISDVQYVQGTAAVDDDTISLNPDFTINYNRTGSTNNISQFTINLLWGSKLQQCVITLQ